MGLANRSSDRITPDVPTVSCVLLTDGLTAETAAWFARVRQVVDELVVLVDRTRANDYTRKVAAALATRLDEVDSKGYVEAHLQQMVNACRGDWILRLDSDERLAPAWHEGKWRRHLTGEHTHFNLPRRWFHTPDSYLTVAPWASDPQMRLFRNVPGEMTFPGEIHEPMAMAGPGEYLCELTIEHHVLWLKTRAEREEKVARYVRLRPEKACADYYLFEEQLAATLQSECNDAPTTMAVAAGC
jgi:hypothetical protein